MELTIKIGNGFSLSPLNLQDTEKLFQYLHDGEISNFIPVIPHPYTMEHAEKWVTHRISFFQKNKTEISFGIRNDQGKLIGSVGVDDLRVGYAHNGEVGYWITKEYRGKGIVSEALKAFIQHAFGRVGLARLTAHTLERNVASIRVLERSGFEREGFLRNYTKTRNGLENTYIFGLLRNSVSRKR